MGSGVIFAVLLVMWLAYLIPRFASWRGHPALEDEIADPFSESRTIIRRGLDPLADTTDPELEVSTPLTRAAARHEIRQLYRLAALRRRRVVLTLAGLTLGTIVLVAVTPVRLGAVPVPALPWWLALVPAVLLLAFLAVARVSVVSLTRTLDARVARVNAAGGDEDTVSFEVPADLRDDPLAGELSVELSAPVGDAGSLWDPIPVTAPTYVSKPMVPRTIRTIDLSMPPMAPVDRAPVVAESRTAPVPTEEATLSVEAVRDGEEYPPASGE